MTRKVRPQRRRPVHSEDPGGVVLKRFSSDIAQVASNRRRVGPAPQSRGEATLRRVKSKGVIPRQYPSAFPDAPPEAEGIARTLSRGLVDGAAE